VTRGDDHGEEPLDERERADHTERVESIVRTFFSESCFFTVTPDARAVPMVAARLSKSTRSFSAGQVVYVYDVFWGVNERARVVGRYRRKHRFIHGVCPIASLVDARPKVVCAPAVLRTLAGTRIDGGILLRFYNLGSGGDFMYFDDYRRHVLGTPVSSLDAVTGKPCSALPNPRRHRKRARSSRGDRAIDRGPHRVQPSAPQAKALNAATVGAIPSRAGESTRQISPDLPGYLHSPKFDALAGEITKQQGCGHIVFCDDIASHAWIRMVLEEAGIPGKRIAVLNARPDRAMASCNGFDVHCAVRVEAGDDARWERLVRYSPPTTPLIWWPTSLRSDRGRASTDHRATRCRPWRLRRRLLGRLAHGVVDGLADYASSAPPRSVEEPLHAHAALFATVEPRRRPRVAHHAVPEAHGSRVADCAARWLAGRATRRE
jgi:hypothetical protein